MTLDSIRLSRIIESALERVPPVRNSETERVKEFLIDRNVRDLVIISDAVVESLQMCGLHCCKVTNKITVESSDPLPSRRAIGGIAFLISRPAPPPPPSLPRD